MQNKAFTDEDLAYADAVSRTDLATYIQQCFEIVSPNQSYIGNWHIDLIAEHLQACFEGKISRLIINIPPRHLKSISVAVAFTTWLLGKNPSEQILCSSYSQRLAEQHSLDARAIVEHPWYQRVFPSTKLVHDQNTKAKFMTTKRGFRMATSVGGAAIGMGGNFLIVDDALSSEQAHSEIQRETANRWFDQTFTTRLNDKKGGCIIVVMQRLHENDLTGHLLRKGGWTHLCIPAIETEDKTYSIGDYSYDRREGELLHEARMGHDEMDREKNELGAYGFSGQYQQQPSPEGGGAFRKDWLQYYENISHEGMNKYIFIDPANSKKKKSDYTAAIVIGCSDDGNIYVLDIVRDKLDVRERQELVFDLHKKYKPKLVAYEKYGMQTDVDWIKKAQEENNYRFRLEEVGGPLSKEGRIERLIPYFFDHKIYLPKRLYKSDYENKLVDVVDSFIHQEYATFPVGLHDDMLDAMSRLCDVRLEFPNTSNRIDYNALYRHMDRRVS